MDMNTIIINCFDTYEHRVDLLYNYFVEKGDSVKVYTSDFRHFEKVKRDDCKANFIMVNTKSYYKNISYKRLLSHYKLSKDIFKLIESEDIDLLWILVPPNSIVRAAAKYKNRHFKTTLIFDIIDLWPETMPITKFKNLQVFNWWRNLRDKNLNVANIIVTECNMYQEKLRDIVGQNKLQTLYLARKISPFLSQLDLSESEVSLCYLGSINNIIDISMITHIIERMKQFNPVILHIIGDGERKDELITNSENAGARVIYHGRVYDMDQKQKIFNQCHFGLNIMKDSVYVGLTMKSIDYFEAGLPIINNIKGDTWDMVDKYRIGINVGRGCMESIIYGSKINRTFVRKVYETFFSISSFETKIEEILKCVDLDNELEEGELS